MGDGYGGAGGVGDVAKCLDIFLLSFCFRDIQWEQAVMCAGRGWGWVGLEEKQNL